MPSTNYLNIDMARLRGRRGEDGSVSVEPSKPNLCCSCLIFVIGNAFAIASIVIGAMYLDECPIEKMIPIYLIVAGCASFLASTLNVVQSYGANHDCMGMARAANWVNGLLSVFALIWLIVGSVYTYRIYDEYTSNKLDLTPAKASRPDYNNPETPDEIYPPNYCNQVVYMFSFVSITFTYCLILLGLLIGVCVCCCGGLLVCCGKNK